jgi:N-acetylglucosaminyl-diphospho-decaprenol L-rhamnosyltransferase
MNHSPMDLSIVILNYKTQRLTRQCIKTIMLYRPAVDFEIIVVDNNSGDGVEEMLRKHYPEARFVQSGKNLGFAAGNNVGIRAATGRYVMILNPDITVKPGAVEAVIRYMDEHKDVGMVGPRLVKPDGNVDESCYRFPGYMIPVYRRTPLSKLAAGRRALDHYLMADYDRRLTREVDWLLGAVLIVRRSALLEVGLFDERYFLYFEDTDWCRRFWQAGHRVVYFTGAEMVHYHERLSARGSWFTSLFRRSTRIHIGSCLKYFRKWGRSGCWRRPDRSAADNNK